MKNFKHHPNFLWCIYTAMQGRSLTAALAPCLAIKSVEVLMMVMMAIFRIDETKHLICVYCTCSCRVCLFFFFGVQISPLLAFKKLTLKTSFSKLNSLTWPSCMFLQPQIRSSTNLNLVVFPFFLYFSSLLLPQGKIALRNFQIFSFFLLV